MAIMCHPMMSPLRPVLIVTSSLHHRYFFPGSVLVHMDSDETTEPIEHEVEFFNIMEVGPII